MAGTVPALGPPRWPLADDPLQPSRHLGWQRPAIWKARLLPAAQPPTGNCFLFQASMETHATSPNGQNHGFSSAPASSWVLPPRAVPGQRRAPPAPGVRGAEQQKGLSPAAVGPTRWCVCTYVCVGVHVCGHAYECVVYLCTRVHTLVHTHVYLWVLCGCCKLSSFSSCFQEGQGCWLTVPEEYDGHPSPGAQRSPNTTTNRQSVCACHHRTLIS